MAADSNVALNKPVTMSSYYDGAPGSLAVDGEKIGDWYDDGCASTNPEINPWITVDLETQYAISSVYILNRLDFSRKYEFLPEYVPLDYGPRGPWFETWSGRRLFWP